MSDPVLFAALLTPLIWIAQYGRILGSEPGRAYLAGPPTEATRTEMRETHANVLTVASIVVAVVAIGSDRLGTVATELLVTSFATLSLSWMLGWSLGSRTMRYFSDALLWTGIALLLAAVYTFVDVGLSRGAMGLVLAVSVLLSWWQTEAYRKSVLPSERPRP